MIREELKRDPYLYMGKNFENLQLNKIEQVYILLKTPELFRYVKNGLPILQRWYVKKCKREELNISNLTDDKAIKRAIKRSQLVIRHLNTDTAYDYIQCVIDECIKQEKTLELKSIIHDFDISDEMIMKIFMMKPSVIFDVAITEMRLSPEIEAFIFSVNPNHIRVLFELHKSTVDMMISKGIDNLKYARRSLEKVDRNILIDSITEDILKNKGALNVKGCVLEAIHMVPEVFPEVIQILYKNGLNKKTNFTVRYLLKTFSELIDDELAAFIIEMED